jgi:hypothetical protein
LDNLQLMRSIYCSINYLLRGTVGFKYVLDTQPVVCINGKLINGKLAEEVKRLIKRLIKSQSRAKERRGEREKESRK